MVTGGGHGVVVFDHDEDEELVEDVEQLQGVIDGQGVVLVVEDVEEDRVSTKTELVLQEAIGVADGEPVLIRYD